MSVDAKKIAALELALKAKTEQLSALHKQMDAAREAIASLESERAANAILTAEIEALRAHQRQDCEPVAWMSRNSADLLSSNNTARSVPVHAMKTPSLVVPLYAAPPKREPQEVAAYEVIDQHGKSALFLDRERATDYAAQHKAVARFELVRRKV